MLVKLLLQGLKNLLIHFEKKNQRQGQCRRVCTGRHFVCVHVCVCVWSPRVQKGKMICMAFAVVCGGTGPPLKPAAAH